MGRVRHCGSCGSLLDPGMHYLTKFCRFCAAERSGGGGKAQARAAVSRAVAKGLLPRASSCRCADCGAQARDYDHRDYSRPLDVEPVCRSCNKLRGPGKPAQSGVESSDEGVRAHREPHSPFFAQNAHP